MYLLELVFAISVIAFVIVALVVLPLRWLWRRARRAQWGMRLLILGIGCLLLASPYLAFQIFLTSERLRHVPAPLHASQIEYIAESDWVGALGPGGNEAGLFAFRLTEKSAKWARDQGSALIDELDGGADYWRATPVCRPWTAYNRHFRDKVICDSEGGVATENPPRLSEYLYEGPAPAIDRQYANEIDHAIQSAGSYYRLGRAGSVTLVDPEKGKVYYFYVN